MPNLHQTEVTNGVTKVVALITRVSGEIVEARATTASPHPSAQETNRAGGAEGPIPPKLKRPDSHGGQVTLQVPARQVPVGPVAPVVAAKVAGQGDRATLR